MYFVGCMQIFIMAAISFERYYSIQNSLKKINKKTMIKVILLCFFVSIFWSLAPLLGWSTYSLEDSLTGCCVEYKSRSINVVSYNIAMFIFVFCIPFGFIFISNVKLVKIVRKNYALLVLF